MCVCAPVRWLNIKLELSGLFRRNFAGRHTYLGLASKQEEAGEEGRSCVAEGKNFNTKTRDNIADREEHDWQISLFPHPSLPSSVHSQEGGDAHLPLWICSVFSFFCLFSVGMAAVREVSLCQVPVGLTPVFEADKHCGVWEVHFHTPTQEHVYTHTHTHMWSDLARVDSHESVKIGVDCGLSLMMVFSNGESLSSY